MSVATTTIQDSLKQSIDTFPESFYKYAPLEQFPSNIQYADKAQITTYSEGQKNDFLAALKWAENHLLTPTRPFIKFSSSETLAAIKSLHAILAPTLYQFPNMDMDLLQGIHYNGRTKPGEFRQIGTQAVLKSPRAHRQYNLSYPEDIFSSLVNPDENNGLDTTFLIGINFVKWYCKFKIYSSSRISYAKELDQQMEFAIQTILRDYPPNEIPNWIEASKNWRKKYFNGKSVNEWLSSFYKSKEGSQFFPEKDLNSNELIARLSLAGLFTKEELEAADKVVYIFPAPEYLEKNALEFVNTLEKLIKTNTDPTEIATFAHEEIVRNHFFENGNGRLARLVMNVVFMNYGYFPLQFEDSDQKKAEYYQAVENRKINSKGFYEFIVKTLEDKYLIALCSAAKNNNVAQINQITTLTLNGKPIIDINASSKAITHGATALHYACKGGAIDAAKRLMGLGGSLEMQTSKGSTPLDLLPDKNLSKELSDFNKELQQMKALKDQQQTLTAYNNSSAANKLEDQPLSSTLTNTNKP